MIIKEMEERKHNQEGMNLLSWCGYLDRIFFINFKDKLFLNGGLAFS